jgi:hypothetical protein
LISDPLKEKFAVENRRIHRRCWALGLALAVSSVPLVAALGDSAPDAQDLRRARREVKLLDDMYKTAIVLVTQHYVNESSDMPAGETFKALFANMREKGWHEVRLLDASGDPINDQNRPQDDFERAAVESLLKGQPYYEQVTNKDGKPVLRAATPIPVVIEKCTMCHENYRGKKVIGALGYTLPLETTKALAP